MVLQFSEKTPQVIDLENRLVELALQYRLEQLESIDQPVLKEGQNAYVGFSDISSFLDQMEGERKQWYYCNC